MDRVLLVIDDIQYGRHVEMTLRKVGFEVESINNEFNLSDSILRFNPDYIITRGTSPRLSTLSVGKKLFDAGAKFSGKSILLFPEGFKISPDELGKIKMDIMLFEPISTLKLTIHVLSFSKDADFDFIKEKLLKFAVTDNQFRNYEKQVLKSAGVTVDSEIQVISGMNAKAENPDVIIGEEAQEFSGDDWLSGKKSNKASSTDKSSKQNQRKNVQNEETEASDSTDAAGAVEAGSSDKQKANTSPDSDELAQTGSDSEPSTEIYSASFVAAEAADVPSEPMYPEPAPLSQEALDRINSDLQQAEMELPLRMDTYNHAIKDIDLDSNVGIKKRRAKKAVNELRKDLINEKKTDTKSEKVLDNEKVLYAQAMFKKKSK